jgi:hypothetical protein
MSQEWIVDVLADLQSFARQNGMSSLAEQLDDTMMVAAAELAQTANGGSKPTDPNAHRVANIHRGLAGSEVT